VQVLVHIFPAYQVDRAATVLLPRSHLLPCLRCSEAVARRRHLAAPAAAALAPNAADRPNRATRRHPFKSCRAFGLHLLPQVFTQPVFGFLEGFVRRSPRFPPAASSRPAVVAGRCICEPPAARARFAGAAGRASAAARRPLGEGCCRQGLTWGPAGWAGRCSWLAELTRPCPTPSATFPPAFPPARRDPRGRYLDVPALLLGHGRPG
jgi:hypothetical protein